MSFYYNYVPRYSGQVNAPTAKAEASAPTNPWAASPPTPGKSVPAPVQPQPQPLLYYSTIPVPEPVKHNFWYGATKAEVDAQNAAVAQATGATTPVQLIPQGATASQQYYCRELDGSYTLRTTNEIMETLQPGYWAFANPGGYPYWVRTKAA